MPIVPDRLTPKMKFAGMRECFELHDESDEIVHAYDAMLAAAPEPWISVEDRLPEEGDEVLGWNGDYTFPALWLKGKWINPYAEPKNNPFGNTLHVKSWMPLPAPPEGK